MIRAPHTAVVSMTVINTPPHVSVSELIIALAPKVTPSPDGRGRRGPAGAGEDRPSGPYSRRSAG